VAQRRILIVNGENTGAADLDARLGGLGYEVSEVAPKEAEAIASAAGAAPDLVLIDIDGSAVARAAQSAKEVRRHWKVPVLFVIAESDEPALRGAGVSEPYGFVVKPFSDRELRANIELALCKQSAAMAIFELEDRFFATSIDLLCFLDFNGHFKRLNPAWERTLGFTRKELMSRPFIEFVHPDDRERTLKQNAQVRGGGQALAFENRYRCKDGSYRWLRWNAAPDSAEKVIYSVARDITESKAAEDERGELLRKLQAALAEVRILKEVLPICAYCKRIRDEDNNWDTIEGYISRHTDSRFTHGICPSCEAIETASLDAEHEERSRSANESG
jgi:PAS domain S-box-containing protein